MLSKLKIMATKTFKIGEYAIGGKIKVSITATAVTIQALDYNSNVVVSETIFSNIGGNYWNVREYLEELTSSYYADKVLQYVIDNSNVNYEMFR